MKRSRTLLVASLVVGVLASVFVWRHVYAANKIWAGTGGSSAWLTAGNWTGGVPGSGDVAQFDAVTNTLNTVGIAGTTTQTIQAVEFTSNRVNPMAIGASGTTGGSVTLAINGTTINGVADTVLRNNSSQLMTIQPNNGQATPNTLSVALGDVTDNKVNIDGTGGITFSSSISGSSRKLTLGGAGTGTLTLGGTNIYTGDTTISSGKLSLGTAGLISSSANIVLAGGSTFDLSTHSAAISMSSGQGLKGTGTSSTGTITLSGTGTRLQTATNSPLQFTAFSGTTAPLTVAGSTAASLTINENNPVTVNTTVALGAGDYTLIAKSGSANVAIVSGIPPTSLTIGGSGLAAGMSAVLQLTSGQLILHVAAAGSLQFSSAPYSDSETNADHTFTVNVSRTGGSNGAVSVIYAVTDGSATTANNDYTVSPASGTLNWANADATNKSFNITVKGDTTFEANETINLTLSSATGGATIGSPNPTTLTITNDDPAAVFSINDVTQAEGNAGTTGYTFTVTKAGSGAATVDYATADGSAVAPADYTAIPTTTLSFTSVETTKQFTVFVNGDTTIEPSEAFFVNLSNASGATISDTQGVGYVITDDVGSAGGKIVFTSNRDGNSEIYVMNADGTAQSQLTYTDAFVENTYPAFSPDGSRIAFVSTRDGNNEIYIMNADGTNQTNITNEFQADDSVPTFSPDGSKIAFASQRFINPIQNVDIYVMNTDGTGLTRLTTDPASDFYPSYSPDGSRIVFMTDREGEFDNEIYIMSSNGGGETNLTNNSLIGDFFPVFSPDGSKIVFESNRDGEIPEIYTMSPSGANVVRVTNNSDIDDFPSFSPDGSKIVFQSLRDDNDPEIYVMNSDGNSVVRLTYDTLNDAHARWAVGDVIALSIDSVSVSEGGGNAVFTVTQSAVTATNTTFTYSTADGSAIAPGDYTAATNVPKTITAGNTTTTITVPIIQDALTEGSENFTVTLSNPVNALIATGTGTGTITDDDVTFNADGNLPAGTYDNITINGPCPTSHYVTLTGNVVINGTFTINDCGNLYTNGFNVSGPGSFVLNADGWLHITSPQGITTAPTAAGNIQTASRSFSTAANYDYDGSANQVVGNGLPGTVNDLLIANSGTSPNNVVTGNTGQVVTTELNVITGVYVSASDYNNVVIQNNGTLSLAANITVSGNWTNNGTFTHNNFGVTFDGGTGQTLAGNTTFFNLTKSTAVAQTMFFTAGSTQTVTSSLTLTGAAGQLLSLRSTTPGTQWNLVAPATQSVSFVDVQDSNASGGQLVVATNSVNSGNNVHWFFGCPASLIVNNIGDGTDFDAGDGVCETATGNGICTLRAAIQEANALTSCAGAMPINFNISGAGVHTITPASALPAITEAVVIDGYTQPLSSVNTLVAADNAVILIELDGTSAGAGVNGLSLMAGGSGSTIRGLVINRFTLDGISLDGSDNCLISGNFIGTDPTGLLDLGNGGNGVEGEYFTGANNNLIGGITPAARNLISGNGSFGIIFSVASGNVIQGNFIGLGADGTTAIGNGGGVDIDTFISGHVIGGDDAADGTTDGVVNARNYISGNGGSGLFFGGTGFGGATVQGNYIGTDTTGTLARPNNSGIDTNLAHSLIVGGTTPGAGNLISGNTFQGISVQNTGGMIIKGNRIGTKADGVSALGNGGTGIFFNASSSNTQIGGTAAGEANVIAFNGDDGVQIDAGTGNVVRANSIHSNGTTANHLGIDLGVDGVTPNDLGDGDPGANNLQNFPVILSAVPATQTISGTLNSTPNTSGYAIDFYKNPTCDGSGNGEGATYIGSTTVTTDILGNGVFSYTAPPSTFTTGDVITATATDPTNNTSEFSACFGSANIYTWNGTVSTDWQVPANWTPTRAVPSSADILYIDATLTPAPIITNVPTQTVAALRLINGTSATLNASAIAPPQTLTVSGATGTDLSVPAGNTLTLASANALKLSIASGSTGVVGGLMLFQDGAHRLLGNAASAATFQSGAIFTTASGFTGNAFGTGAGGDGTAGSIIFANGSNYFHNAGGSPFGVSPNPAVAVFQTGSKATFLTATGFEANGRTYADLAIGKIDPGGIAVNASDSGTGDFTFDRLEVNSTGTTNSSLTYNGSGTSAINIRERIDSNGVGNGGTLPDVILTAGSGGIVMNNPTTVVFGNDGNNTRAVEFESSASVGPTTELLLNRKLLVGISQPSSFILTVNGVLNGSIDGYVIGKVKRPVTTTPDPFIFHVGTPNGYAPLDATFTAGTGDLTVLARQGAQPQLNSATSLQRYWNLTEGGAGITADLTFHYNQADVNGSEPNYRLVIVEGGNATQFPEDCPDVACVDETANTIRRIGVETFSDWTAGEPNAPTAVNLTGFTAERNQDEVTLRWSSGYEARNLGYNVYREQNGQRTRLTPSLVAGSALVAGRQTEMTAGRSYTWYDAVAKGKGVSAEGRGQRSEVSYWLEDVDLNGTRTMHGPIVPVNVYSLPKGGKIMRSDMIGEVGRRSAASGVLFDGWAASFAEQQARITRPPFADPDRTVLQRDIESRPGVKIAIKKSGYYRITQPELLAAGIDPNTNWPQLQLYANGRPVPIKQSGDEVHLTPSDYIEFYAHGLESATDAAQTYYLVVADQFGSRIHDLTYRDPQPMPPPSGAPSFAYTVERKERMIYFSGLLNGDLENFFGQIVSTSPASSTMPVGGLSAGTPAQLEIALQGVTNQGHLVQVKFNGAAVGTIDFSNTEHPVVSFDIPAGSVQEGNNNVELTSLGGAADVSLVDVMRLTYARSYVADNNRLAFSVDTAETKRVGGFTTSNLRVLDITDPDQVVNITPTVVVNPETGGTWSVDMQVQEANFRQVHTLMVFADEQPVSPDSVKRNYPSSWWSQTAGADYVIITSRELLAGLEPLAQLRRNQGLVVQVIDVEDLYDEFSFGKHSPEAIQGFLQLTKDTWTSKPRYVLLAGDASYDPKDYFGQGQNDLVPTRLIDTSLLETASDDWLADFNGDGVADLAVGRLPVRTAGAADLLVAKIVNYENTAPDPSRGALLVSDTSFESLSSSVQTLLPAGLPVQSINRGSGNDAAIHNQIVASINQGPRVANYFGHGSNGVWTSASLLSNPDAALFTNTNRLSVFTMMTCFNGFFHDAYNDSLAEALLKAPGGAVAVWASTSMTEPGGQATIDQEFYRMIFAAQPATLGDAARAAKLTTSDADVRRTWTLFGDPAMRIR